jgi:LuxR family maltose regulon positive regulatory protein
MCALGAGEESPQARVLRLVVEGFLHIAQGAYETALERLSQAEALAESVPLASIYVCPPIIRAYALLRMGNRDAALELFTPILTACAEAGTPGVILQEGQTAVALLELAEANGFQAEYARQLLAQLRPVVGAVCEPLLHESPLPDGIMPLTERELQVLRLLAAGASNKDIAEALVISLATVKSHVSHILSKLDVSSRGQAGARARDLDLV